MITIRISSWLSKTPSILDMHSKFQKTSQFSMQISTVCWNVPCRGFNTQYASAHSYVQYMLGENDSVL